MRSKAFAKKVVQSFVRMGAPVVIVNPTWTVGPGVVFMTPVAQAIRSVIQGQQPSLSPAGINIVDVDDVGEGHCLAEEKGRIGSRYLLADENVVYSDFQDEISGAAGVPSLPVLDSAPSSFPKDYLWYDSTLARQELGWSSRPLRETVKRAVDYLRSQL